MTQRKQQRMRLDVVIKVLIHGCRGAHVELKLDDAACVIEQLQGEAEEVAYTLAEINADDGVEYARLMRDGILARDIGGPGEQPLTNLMSAGQIPSGGVTFYVGDKARAFFTGRGK